MFTTIQTLLKSAAAITILLFVSSCVQSGGSDALTVGSLHSGYIAVGADRMQVPLPAGEWEVASAQHKLKSNGETRFNVILFSRQGNKVKWIMHVNVPLVSTGSYGWSVNPECSRPDMHYINVPVNIYLGEQDCRYVNYSTTSVQWNDQPYLVDADKYAKANNVDIPPVMVSSNYSIADKRKYLAVSYYWNPEVYGLPRPRHTSWAASEWHRDSLNKERKTFISSVIKWTDDWHEKVMNGFRGKLAAPPSPLVISSSPAPTTPPDGQR